MAYQFKLRFESPVATQDLVARMQSTYDDNGVAGNFVIETPIAGAARLFSFVRDEVEDRDYVYARLAQGTPISDERLVAAAAEQLYAELSEYDYDPVLEPIMAAVKRRDFVFTDVVALR